MQLSSGVLFLYLADERLTSLLCSLIYLVSQRIRNVQFLEFNLRNLGAKTVQFFQVLCCSQEDFITFFFWSALSAQFINVVCSSALEMCPVQCWQHVFFFPVRYFSNFRHFKNLLFLVELSQECPTLRFSSQKGRYWFKCAVPAAELMKRIQQTRSLQSMEKSTAVLSS